MMKVVSFLIKILKYIVLSFLVSNFDILADSLQLPYQLIRFEDRDQLKEYLMRCYDVDTTGECASPFILENDRVL